MKQVIEEPVLVVPHFVVVLTNSIHGVCDPEKMLHKPESDILVHRVILRQNERDLQHVLAIESHPSCTVRLVEVTARGKGSTAIEDANVVEPEESACKNILPLRVLPVDPPVEILHEALKRSFQETNVGSPQFAFDIEEEQCCPCMDRGIHVAEIPFVRWDLSVGMGIQIPQHEEQLVLGEVEVHKRQGNCVKSQVPSGIPGIFPLVGHRDDVAIQHVEPLGIPDIATTGAQQRVSVMLLQPLVQIEVVILLAPQHAG